LQHPAAPRGTGGAVHDERSLLPTGVRDFKYRETLLEDERFLTNHG
jgi:hypothetical protein